MLRPEKHQDFGIMQLGINSAHVVFLFLLWRICIQVRTQKSSKNRNCVIT
jgi:hypothetical protein